MMLLSDKEVLDGGQGDVVELPAVFAFRSLNDLLHNAQVIELVAWAWNFLVNNRLNLGHQFWIVGLSWISQRQGKTLGLHSWLFYAVVVEIISLVISVEDLEWNSRWISAHCCHASPGGGAAILELVHDSIDATILVSRVLSSKVEIHVALVVEVEFFGYALSRLGVLVIKISGDFEPLSSIQFWLEVVHDLKFWASAIRRFSMGKRDSSENEWKTFHLNVLVRVVIY